MDYSCPTGITEEIKKIDINKIFLFKDNFDGISKDRYGGGKPGNIETV